jgi:hypothetical protein
LGTTPSVNAGLANLLQTLTNIGSPLASSPTIVAALQKASPGDIVQLSNEATQTEELNAIFGSPTDPSAPSGTDSLLSYLYDGNANPIDPLTGSTSGGSTTSSNAAVTDLTQDLSNVGLSQQDVAALQNASPSDIVQLSAEATQLAGLNALFGQPDASQTGNNSNSQFSSVF